MSAGGDDAIEAGSRISRQIPSFAAIGLIGYVVDAGESPISAPNISACRRRSPARRASSSRRSSISPSTARSPSATPRRRWRAPSCAIAWWRRLGLAVNYAVYSLCARLLAALGLTVTPEILPLFVAAGSGVAMVVTFVGFRWFAFRA